MSSSVFLSIGTNKGDKISNCKLVIKKISSISNLLNISSVYKSQSWGFSADFFLNFIIEVQTNFTPSDFLKELLRIESQMGRVRKSGIRKKYESRVIDIDILFFGDQIIESKTLIIPHPRLYYRNFILKPLCELRPSLLCPILNKEVEQIFKECQDDRLVEKFIDKVDFKI